MKTSTALKRTLEHLWDGSKRLRYIKWACCCHAAQAAGPKVAAKVEPVLMHLLCRYSTLDSWLEGEGHATRRELTDNPRRLQETRRQWLLHLIEHYEAMGD